MLLIIDDLSELYQYALIWCNLPMIVWHVRLQWKRVTSPRKSCRQLWWTIARRTSPWSCQQSTSCCWFGNSCSVDLKHPRPTRCWDLLLTFWSVRTCTIVSYCCSSRWIGHIIYMGDRYSVIQIIKQMLRSADLRGFFHRSCPLFDCY